MRAIRSQRLPLALASFFVLFALLVPAGLAGAPHPVAPSHPTAAPLASAATPPGSRLLGPAAAVQMVPIPDGDGALSVAPGSRALGPAPPVAQRILLVLNYNDSPGLARFLGLVGDPSSPAYHQYLTASEFDAAFAPSSAVYGSLLSYLRAGGATDLTTFSDRDSVAFDATPAVLRQLFAVTMELYAVGATGYVAPEGSPALPSNLAPYVAAVEGLSTSPLLQARTASSSVAGLAFPTSQAAPRVESGAYLAPPTVGGVQLEYAADFQVGYDQLSLFQQYGYPTNAVVATILWSGEYTGTALSTPNGTLATDQFVGPYVPWVVQNYFDATLPAGEPYPTFQAVPIGGAPGPGPLASYDSIGANLENTLDLEMVGSLAPGAQIYNVYGTGNSLSALDTDFSSILNPSGLGAPNLANVSVISNSWYADDTNDTGWYQDLQQAQARGISVLACTGDSGNDAASSKYRGSNAAYPASEAFGTFGTTGVGGSDDTLNAATLLVNGLKVWYIAPNDVALGGPAGTEGGISTVFSEPTWQRQSLANEEIHGAGRALPDISGQANRTLISYDVDDFVYKAANASLGGSYEWAWGTSVACPMEAGILADTDHILNANAEGGVGYLNPLLYNLSSREDSPVNATATTGWYEDAGFDSVLPTNPIMNVSKGSNFLYSANKNFYSLVTGWGNLDAYNFTAYFLTARSSGIVGRLSAIRDLFNISGLSVTTPDSSYSASIQQNFFVANSLGAPIYWIQNVIYFTATGSPSTWDVEDSGWIVYPFYGIYYYQAGYEYNWPAGTTFSVPGTEDVYTTLEPGTGFNVQRVVFNVGAAHVVSLAVPGGAYILGNRSQSYSWKGVTEWNGPFPDNAVPGGLAPQFGLVGGPSGGNGSFVSPTAATLVAYVQPFGSSGWTPAQTSVIWPSIDQTGEDASNQQWTSTAANRWTLGTSTGSAEQGIVSFQGTPFPVTASETGLPAGERWYVNLTNGISFSSTQSSFTFEETNGTFGYTLGSGSGDFSGSPTPSTVTINGGGTITATFTDDLSAGVPSLNRTLCETSCGIALNETYTGGWGAHTATVLWGDGSPGQVLGVAPFAATHAYAVAGSYQIRVYVNDSTPFSSSALASSVVQVDPHLELQPIVPTSWHAVAPSNVSFSAASVVAGTGSGTVSSYLWSYGNGNSSTTAAGSAFQIYYQAGSYTITVVATDSLGYKAGASVVISVWGSAAPMALMPGWNLVALTGGPSDYTLFELSQLVGTKFLSIQDLQTGVTYTPGSAQGNSPVGPGDALWVDDAVSKTITLFGNASAPTVFFSAQAWTGVGWSAAGGSTLGAIAGLAGSSVGYVSFYNATNQVWVTYIVGFDAPSSPEGLQVVRDGQAVEVWSTSVGSFVE